MSSRPVKPTYWVQGQPGLHKPESCSLFTNPSSQSTAVLVMHIFLEPITCLEGRATSWVLLGLRFGAKLLISPQIICADCLESLKESERVNATGSMLFPDLPFPDGLDSQVHSASSCTSLLWQWDKSEGQPRGQAP